MLPGSRGGMVQAKKQVVERYQALLHIWIGRRHSFGESFLQGIMVFIKVVEEADEIQRVGSIESPMFEIQQFLQIVILMINYKIVWSVIHQLKQKVAITNDGFS